jgi:hypothetical protein
MKCTLSKFIFQLLNFDVFYVFRTATEWKLNWLNSNNINKKKKKKKKKKNNNNNSSNKNNLRIRLQVDSCTCSYGKVIFGNNVNKSKFYSGRN